MATLTLRNTEGRPLTYTEIDDNFSNLNSDIATLDGGVVKTSGNQSVGGTKTFTASMVAPNYTLSGTAATVGYSGTGNSRLVLNKTNSATLYGGGSGYIQVTSSNVSTNGNMTANKFIVSGGSANNLLCADGSVVAKSSVGGSSYDGSDAVKLTGNQTIAGTKTFSSTISGSINGNAGTVTNGVYTSGNQTIAGTKTFSSAPVSDFFRNNNFGIRFGSRNGRLHLFPVDTSGNTANNGADIGFDDGSVSKRWARGYFGGSVYAAGFITNGGTSSQLVQGDGSLVAKSSIGGTNYTAGTGLVINGTTIAMTGIYQSTSQFLVNSTAAGSSLTVQNDSSARGAEIRWHSGSKSMYARLSKTSGTLEFVNSAYSAVRFFFEDAGNFRATGTVQGSDCIATSDARLKRDFEDVKTGVITQLTPLDYIRKTDEKKASGFTAQEVETIPELAHLVHTSEEGTKSLSYMGMIPYLLAEIKQLRSELDTLTA